jgi:hypothetical protein
VKLGSGNCEFYSCEIVKKSFQWYFSDIYDKNISILLKHYGKIDLWVEVIMTKSTIWYWPLPSFTFQYENYNNLQPLELPCVIIPVSVSDL